jgi:hypothetical protein
MATDAGTIERTPCVVYTVDTMFSGLLHRRPGRFSDALNAPDQDMLFLHDVEINALGSPLPPKLSVSRLVQRDQVVVVVPHGAESNGQTQPDLRVAKRPVDEFIKAPPFVIHGIVHLPPPIEILNPSQRWLPPFIPVTKARILYSGSDNSPVTMDAPFLLLNRRFIEMLFDTAQVTGAGRGSKPA